MGLPLRAGTAVLAGIVIGLGALFLIARGGDSRSQLSANHNFVPTLSLIRQATAGGLVSLQIAPFQVGTNSFRISLLNLAGEPERIESARLVFSRLDADNEDSSVDSTQAGQSRDASFVLSEAGWWQIDAVVNHAAKARFYVRLDQPSAAPIAFASPNYESNPAARQLFESTLVRYKALTSLMWREELTSGDARPSGFGVWFVTNVEGNLQGIHATTTGMNEPASELYSDQARQCFRHNREPWQCTNGSAPNGPFDLSYLRGATGFKMGPEEVVDGEETRVVFFYNPSQKAWYAWWIAETTGYLRRQAMVAPGHFMLSRYTNHNEDIAIQPRDLSIETR